MFRMRFRIFYMISSYNYIYQDGAGGFTFTTEAAVDPAQYDDGSGALASVGASQATVQWVFWSPRTNNIYVQYGQELYTSFLVANALWANETINFETTILSDKVS